MPPSAAHNPRFNRTQTYNYPVTSAAAASATARQVSRIPGVQATNLVGVRIDGVGCDRGELDATGTAIQTVRFKLKPVRQPGLFGGDVDHYFANVDSLNRNLIRFDGCVLYPEEATELDLLIGTNGRTVILTFFRTLLFLDPV